MTENQILVLDHGYVRFVESWGSDERIIEAARMSTAKGFQGWGELRCRCGATSTTAHWDGSGDGKISRLFHDAEDSRCPIERGGAHVAIPDSKTGDEKLLRYLWQHKHATPFEMAGMILEIQAPIMVFREWHRHRTQSYNELSARYTPLPDVNYIPTPERCIVVPGRNKQASGASARVPTHGEVLTWLEHLAQAYAHSQVVYQEGLDLGIPKEVARLPVPVARYSRMRAAANLRNWLGFLTLRLDPAAQLEIRLFATAVGGFIKEAFPRTWDLFAQGLTHA